MRDLKKQNISFYNENDEKQSILRIVRANQNASIIIQMEKVVQSHNAIADDVCILLTQMLRNKWNPNRSPFPIPHIIIPKESHKQFFFPTYSPREEPPQHQCIAQKTDWVSEYELCA
jgi:hypothetical protein